METKKVLTNKAPQAIGPYSQAVKKGNMVFVSGQLPITPNKGIIEDLPISEQTKMVINNISEILKEANSGLDDIVKTTIFLTNLADFKKVNEVYGSFFKEPYPARATVEVSNLPLGSKIEIEVIAIVD